METRAGKYITNLSGEAAYKSFVPSPLPPQPPVVLSNGLVELVADATAKLALLEREAANIPNVGLFVSMYVRKEALMSSQIEGTQATLEDVLDPAIAQNTNRDVADVVNYIKAVEFAVKRLREFPLCCRLIRETHAVLMKNVRGQDKCPEEFRHSQNWIGGGGCGLKEAKYIPPSPEDMTEAISDLEKYINCDDGMNVLLRAALIHYQFETIHPFLDGNGRIGRLLITLFLMEQKVLTTPSLYISYFLKKNRIEYYDRMTEVRRTGNYEQWIVFFLQALSESADDAVSAIGEMTKLHDENMAKIAEMGRGSASAARLFDYLEANPIIDISRTAQALSVSFNTASAAAERLVNAGILKQTGKMSRNRTFAYEKYLEILRRGT